MMHGHTVITLTDPTTGRVTDRREEDNLVTDVIKDMMRLNPFAARDFASITLSNACGGLTPLAQYAYGGIVLFGDTNTEDAGSYWPGADNPIRGYASMHSADMDGVNDPMRGTYNTTESGPIAKGWRWVYDWPTDRGNGEIKSISLTSRAAGRQWYGNALYGNNSSAGTVRPFVYYGGTSHGMPSATMTQSSTCSLAGRMMCDETGVHAVTATSSYGMQFTASYWSGTPADSLTITISTIKWTPGTFGLTEDPCSLGSKAADVTATIPGDWGAYRQKDGSQYNEPTNIQYVGANWAGSLLHLYKWSGNETGDATITHATVTTSGNVTVETITSPVQLQAPVKSKSGSYWNVSYSGGGCVSDGSLIAMGWGCDRFWKIPLDDPSHPVEIPLPDEIGKGWFARNGGQWKLDAGIPGTPPILWTDGGGTCTRLRGTQWMRAYGDTEIENAFQQHWNADAPNVGHGYYRYGSSCIPWRDGPYLCAALAKDNQTNVSLAVGVDQRYLGTINNLADPITKTSDRTMKITYTLTEA